MITASSFWTMPIGVRVSIAAQNPKGFDGQTLREAAPTWTMLHRYRVDQDWEKYSREYMDLLDGREPELVREVNRLHERREQMTLCCWCHSESRCHRRLLKSWLLVRGIEIAAGRAQ